MEPLLFFIAGLPIAFFANRLVQHFTVTYAGEEQDEAARVLPWQRQPWARYVRLACVVSLPPLMALAGARFDLLGAAAISLFLLGLILCTATDLLHYRVPNVITYPGVVLAVFAAALLPGGDVISALASALVAGFTFLVLAIITRGGIGLGDVKLAAMIGAGLGFPAAYQAMATGVIAGGVIILVLWLAGVVTRKQAVPYAPFLAVAAVIFALQGGASFAPLS